MPEFQSAPAITGGRCVFAPLEAEPVGPVSIRARHYWRAMRVYSLTVVWYWLVSIRARHYWRAMPWARARSGLLMLFQSAPAITGGRCSTSMCRASASRSFNPRPPLLAGDAVIVSGSHIRLDVSIRARHYWRAMRGHASWCGSATRVSIRARHYWRAMLPMIRTRTNATAVSIRARHYWRAMHADSGDGAEGCSFNPRPPLLAGDA